METPPGYGIAYTFTKRMPFYKRFNSGGPRYGNRKSRLTSRKTPETLGFWDDVSNRLMRMGNFCRNPWWEVLSDPCHILLSVGWEVLSAYLCPSLPPRHPVRRPKV